MRGACTQATCGEAAACRTRAGHVAAQRPPGWCHLATRTLTTRRLSATLSQVKEVSAGPLLTV